MQILIILEIMSHLKAATTNLAPRKIPFLVLFLPQFGSFHAMKYELSPGIKS